MSPLVSCELAVNEKSLSYQIYDNCLICITQYLIRQLRCKSQDFILEFEKVFLRPFHMLLRIFKTCLLSSVANSLSIIMQNYIKKDLLYCYRQPGCRTKKAFCIMARRHVLRIDSFADELY